MLRPLCTSCRGALSEMYGLGSWMDECLWKWESWLIDRELFRSTVFSEGIGTKAFCLA